jgi:hypothetical protein
MFEVSRYIGPNAPTKNAHGFHLPAMPKQSVPKASHQYRPDQEFILHPDVNNTMTHHRDDRTVHMKLVRPLKIGYGRKVQTVLAEVQDGRMDLLGTKVVMRCFDTLCVTPDLLELIPFRRCRSCRRDANIVAPAATDETGGDLQTVHL